ncbi:MAG: hypothetical protein ABI644_13115 [Arenimonas sp.]
MSAIGLIRQWQNAAKNRQFLISLLLGLPMVPAIYFLSAHYLSAPPAMIIALAVMVAATLFAMYSIRVFNDAWLIRQLDIRLRNLEDSSDLLFKPSADLSNLQNLQRQRIEQRISQTSYLDLGEAWPWKKIALSFVIATGLGVLATFLPNSNTSEVHTFISDVAPLSPVAAPAKLIDQSIAIRAPAYTGLSARDEKNLQVKFPEGSTLSWNLEFDPQPASVSLLFHDGNRLALKKNGDHWQASKTLLQSSLYRLQVNNAALSEDKLYRLDAIKDLPPALRVIQPDRNLSLVELGQTDWPLSFEAEDDYGLGAAELRIQLAQGSGENIKFTEQTRSIVGQGSRSRKRYSQKLDLTSLGVGPGDDVIVQLSISDQRTPQANTTRSSSFILRWPAEASIETTGVEGMVQKAIPAYFRSQRQIIIDTEKLLSERKNYATEKFAVQSDTIGVDQRILRLRYGQFLGEEAEGGRDESASPSAKEGKDEHGEHAGEPPKKPTTSADSNLAIAAEFGHVHDIAEAATLLEPKTKALLRAALNEMWQAELHLRQAEPKQALPYEYRALAFIKKVQQADRIYLARVGLELPPVDETRRLSGDRSSVKNRNDVLQAANNEDLALMQFWQSLNSLELGEIKKNSEAPDFTALRNWIREHSSRSPDSLGLLAAVDALEKQPGCVACLAEMKAQLWPMLPKPPAIPQQRTIPDPVAQKYLDALQQERRP